MNIYVPEDTTYNKCYVLQNESTIRGYASTPAYSSNISYRDYFINSSYIYRDGVQTFGQYSTLPTCINTSNITNNVFYRNDIDKILIIFLIILLICFYFPYKIISRMLGRWFKV